jgi:ABC-type nitrate/sulfonate/bicarbonate transport system permease component
MMQQLARGQTSLAFAALLALCVLAVTLYFAVDALMRRLAPWADAELPR